MWGWYWNYTTCIHCNDLVAVEQAITTLLEQEEGVYRLSELPPLEICLEQLRRQGKWDRSCNLWIVSLFAGNDGWTIIKTWPNELLCHKAANDSRPRLSVLAMQLNCDAFYLGAYDDIFGILLETNASGQIHVAGVYDADVPSERFYQQPINKPDLIDQFYLLKVSEPIQAAARINQSPKLKQRLAELEQLAEKNPELRHDPDWEQEVCQYHTERIDRALEAVLNGSNSWYWHGLPYSVYAEPDELAAAGARLLYFQPPTNYKLPQAYTMTRKQWLDIFGVEPPENY
jgi:hypothetical protein